MTSEARRVAAFVAQTEANGLREEEDEAPDSKKPRTSVSDGYISVTTRSQKVEFDELVGEFFIENDVAFAAADSPSWRRLIHALRATYDSACAKTLSSTILERIAGRAAEHLVQTVRDSPVVALSTDGWSNVRGERFLHIMVCVPMPLLWDSIDVGESAVEAGVDPCMSGEFIAEKLLHATRDIEQKTGKQVAAIVTNNAANMKKAWDIVKGEKPRILTYGCVAHIINLFIGDCVKNSVVFGETVRVATLLADRIKNSPNILAKVRSMQRREYGKEFSFFLPGNTRWFSTHATIASVLRSRRALCTYGIDCDIEEYKKVVNDDKFWGACRAIEPLLRQCCLSILMVEADGTSIESAFPAMIAIGTAVEEWIHPERDAILKLYRERAAFLYSPALVMASALNPV